MEDYNILRASVACKHNVPASKVIAEFFGNTFLNSLNKSFWLNRKIFFKFFLSLLFKNFFFLLNIY
jgi:hypothetical protein